MENESDILAIFVTIAALLYLVEGAIPKPFPWLKLGLSNIITIIALFYFDFKFVLKLVFFRVFTGSLITGTLFTPTFFLSISGGLSAAISMFIVYKICKDFITSIGISIVGAEAHILAQIMVVYFFIIKDKTIFTILPILLSISLFTGFFIGCIAEKVILKLNNSNYNKSMLNFKIS